jgi:hypothetical protein
MYQSLPPLRDWSENIRKMKNDGNKSKASMESMSSTIMLLLRFSLTATLKPAIFGILVHVTTYAFLFADFSFSGANDSETIDMIRSDLQVEFPSTK